METIITTISFTLVAVLVGSPILIKWELDKQNLGKQFKSYLTIAIAFTALTIIVFAWWSDFSDRMLLIHYGYNLDGMNEGELYQQVCLENRERVKTLEKSLTGIGWPLKAAMSYILYIPYLLLAYFLGPGIRFSKKNYI